MAAPARAPKPDAAQLARQKEKMGQELKELEATIAPLLQGEQFAAVTALLEEARKRYDASEWSTPLAARINEVQELPTSLLPTVKSRATAATDWGWVFGCVGKDHEPLSVKRGSYLDLKRRRHR